MGRCEFLREYAHYHWADHTECTFKDVLSAIAVSHPDTLVGAKRRNSVAMVKSALKRANQGKPFIPNADRRRVHRNSKKVKVSPFIKMVVNARRGGSGNSVRRVTAVLQQAGFTVEKSTVGSVMKKERESIPSVSMVSAVQDVAMSASPLDPEVEPVLQDEGVTRDIDLSECSDHSAPTGLLAALSDGSVSPYDSAPRGPMTLDMLKAHFARQRMGSTDLNLSESSSVDIPLPPAMPKDSIAVDSPTYSAGSHSCNHSPPLLDDTNLSSSHHSDGSGVHSDGSSVSSGKYSLDDMSQGPDDIPPVDPIAKPVVSVRNKYLEPAPYDTEPETAPSKGKSTVTVAGAMFENPNGVSSSSSSDESSSDTGSKGRSKGRCSKGKFTKGHTPWNKKV